MLFNKYMFKYYKKYFVLYLVGILALIAVDYVQLFIPEFLGSLVNIVNDKPANMMDEVSRIVLYVVGIAVVMFLGRMLWRFTLFSASQRIEAGLRHEMFLKSERLSQKYYHENKVGSIMSWFTTDLETIEEYCGFGTVTLVDAVFLGVLVIIRMIKMDWALSIIVFIPMILIIIWGTLVEKYMSMKWTQRQEAFDNLYDFTQETFTGIRVIKAFVKETSELHAFAKIARKNKDMNVSFARISVIFDVLIELIIAAIMAMCLGIGGWAVYSTLSGNPMVIFNHTVNLDAGDLVTFTGYFDTLIWPLIAMGQIVAMRSRSKASLKRVQAFLDANEDIKNPKNPYVLENVSGKITFNHFSFHYPDAADDVKSLNDITFEILPGETIGIIGKIGCGKTTLVNSLLRLYNVDKGSILIDGHDIMDCDITSIRNSIAYVPQDNFLFSDKIYNNIAFSDRKKDRVAIQNAAIFADVHDNIVNFKNGYDTISGERGVSLSGGQKQRISIARAIFKDSEILAFDDSFSALDLKTDQELRLALKNMPNRATNVIVAQRIGTIINADKIVVLDKGEVVGIGTHKELLESCSVYQEIAYSQLSKEELENA